MTVTIVVGDALTSLREMDEERCALLHNVADVLGTTSVSRRQMGRRGLTIATISGARGTCPHLRWKVAMATTHGAKEGWPSSECGKCGARLTGRMIRLERTFDEHLENLVAVFREVGRVLRDDATHVAALRGCLCGRSDWATGQLNRQARSNAQAPAPWTSHTAQCRLVSNPKTS